MADIDDVLAAVTRLAEDQRASFRDIRRIIREDRATTRSEYRDLAHKMDKLNDRFEDMFDDVAGFRRELLNHLEGHTS